VKFCDTLRLARGENGEALEKSFEMSLWRSLAHLEVGQVSTRRGTQSELEDRKRLEVVRNPIEMDASAQRVTG
jgi:hypothetical protein